MFCSKCGSECKDDWSVCPKCANKLNPVVNNSNQSSTLAYRLLAALFGILILILAANCMFSSHSSTNTQNKDKSRQILITAGFEKGFIVIKNDNDFDWTNATITVANGVTSQYSLYVGTIKSQEIKSYQLSKFTSSSGEIYNSNKYVPKQVLVKADNANGGKQY